MLKKLWRSSRFFIVFYAIVLLASLILQKYNFQIPLETLAKMWPFLMTAYTGLDRYVDFMNTKQMKSGEVSLGDLPKLRFLIVLCFLLLVVSVTLQQNSDLDYKTEQFCTTFALSIITYTGGNKLVKSCKHEGSENADNSISNEL